ncbi:hypothetical protein ABB27_08605 [Stenotrophomonas terrae]|uniref:TonB C-terminal domain-containing protein n=1 Tax=Stenotrophomonas terrae TaxID=405446 RepID=A0A0R0CEH0_9GAMM|nr:TonB family protein [Stenotrophomonas terrae]KRG67632.1 hypothetical protein ABB27_08605 [Stenotrophomonas terrae]
MLSKMMSSMLLVVAVTVSPSVIAGNAEPLQLAPSEALKLWTPSAGEFHPRIPANPGKAGFAEEVTVAYTVTKRGRTKDVEVIEAKPAGASSEWALNAVKAMRFDPTESNSARQPVRSQLSTHWDGPAR